MKLEEYDYLIEGVATVVLLFIVIREVGKWLFS
jgi:hypothetical protein